MQNQCRLKLGVNGERNKMFRRQGWGGGFGWEGGEIEQKRKEIKRKKTSWTWKKKAFRGLFGRISLTVEACRVE